jgi:maltooligosyltrehalose trehalohydrolase
MRVAASAAPMARVASLRRRLPGGAEVVPEGVHFRVWAPRARRVEVLLEGGAIGARAPVLLERSDDG